MIGFLVDCRACLWVWWLAVFLVDCCVSLMFAFGGCFWGVVVVFCLRFCGFWLVLGFPSGLCTFVASFWGCFVCFCWRV